MFEKGDIMETIRNVDVNRLHDFKNHPFKVEIGYDEWRQTMTKRKEYRPMTVGLEMASDRKS